MSLARETGFLLLRGQQFLPVGTWRREFCARRTDGGSAAVALSSGELHGMLIAAGAGASEIADLGPLSAIQVGTFCNCGGGGLWLKVGDVVWSDGTFISRPSGLNGAGLEGSWVTQPPDCQSESLS